jgi:hypothetical protein
VFTSPCPQQLTHCLGFLPDVITDPVIETAKNRAHILRETRELFLNVRFRLEPTDIRGQFITDASLEFGLQPANGVFIQQQFINFQQQLQQQQQQLDHCFARMEATIANARILSRNRRNMSDTQRPLRKYVGFPAVAVHCGT